MSTQKAAVDAASSDNKSRKSTEGPHTDTHLNLAWISIHMLHFTGRYIIWKLIVHANALSLANKTRLHTVLLSLLLETNAMALCLAHCKLIILQVIHIASEWGNRKRKKQRNNRSKRDTERKGRTNHGAQVNELNMAYEKKNGKDKNTKNQMN